MVGHIHGYINKSVKNTNKINLFYDHNLKKIIIIYINL